MLASSIFLCVPHILSSQVSTPMHFKAFITRTNVHTYVECNIGKIHWLLGIHNSDATITLNQSACIDQLLYCKRFGMTELQSSEFQAGDDLAECDPNYTSR